MAELRIRFLQLFLAGALGVWTPSLAFAIELHNFDCKNCHKTGVSFTDLGNGSTNVCLQCHKDNPSSTPMLDGSDSSPTGLFAPGDASNAMDSYPDGTTPPSAPGAQSSHMWAARDDNPAAGAQPPSDWRFYGRYGISNGKVTCQRCHDPHTRDPANTKILRNYPDGKEALCIECHTPWNIDNSDHGLLSHPMVSDYAAVQTAKSEKYKTPSEVAAAEGEVSLVNGGVSCSTCHGVHFADSEGSTVDGPGQTLASGDGKLLKADGLNAGDASALCQACHAYKAHGSEVETVGCLVCHSGHSYNGGNPNYYVLRDDAETTTYGAVGGLSYTDLTTDLGGSSSTTFLWGGMAASANGYCERCHGELTTMAGSTRSHPEGENCKDCHSHNGSGMTYAFEANCTDCHGWPPATTSPGGPDGYAFLDSPARDYSADGDYKAENTTAHVIHTGSTSAYRMSCGRCHDDDFANTHNDGNYQNVFTGATPDGLSSAGGVLSPNYAKASPGTCTNIYCHSNGGRRNPTGTKVLADFDTKTVTWTGETITSCDACHGNDAASMNGLNSPSHVKHLNKGYSCNICHDNTATGANALADGAETGSHVDGDADVSFDNDYLLSAGNNLGLGSYGTDGTCSIYCHSDGQGTKATPDWDISSSGDCGTCHSITPTSGSHNQHTDSAGANIACKTCHGNGAGSGEHSGHVDGAFTVVAGVCDNCHARDAADGTATPTWGDSTTAVCDSCHAGTDTTSYTDKGSVLRTAPAKTAFFSAGHGKATATGGSTPPDIGCTSCHDTTYDATHMGAGETYRLQAVGGQSYDAAAPNAFCSACHDNGSADEVPHYASGGSSTDGTKCNICHDPHGKSGYDAMIRNQIGGRSVSAFTDKTDRTYYANGSYNGVCQVCHVDGEVSRFNLATYQSSHGNGEICTNCHKHVQDTAFEPTCYNCHGGGSTGSNSGLKNFWPDEGTAYDRSGEHQVHMLKIAERFDASWVTIDALLNGATKVQQRQMCEYCHAAVDNDQDHMAASSAEVFDANLNGVATRFAKKIWDGSDDADAGYSAGSCSSVDCHKGKTTPAGYFWYDGGTSACIMCHLDITADTSHTIHTGGTWSIGCASCHDGSPDWAANTPPSSAHINGTLLVLGSRTFTYDDSGPKTCGTNECHNDGNMNAPDVAYDWSSGSTAGFCAACHGVPVDSNMHVEHFNASEGTLTKKFVDSQIFCNDCHTHASAKGTGHLDGDVDFKTGISYSGDMAIGDRSNPGIEGNEYGKCTTTLCHSDGKGGAVVTPRLWNATSQTSDDCSQCHSDLPSTGSHGKHVRTEASNYPTAANNNSLAADYDFGCGYCHGTTLSNHLDGSVMVSSQGWDGFKCTASYCHSNGAYDNGDPATTKRQYANSPDWAGGTFSGDKCAACHLNIPDTNAHEAHEVGFHFDSVYSGLTGFLPVQDNDCDPKDTGQSCDPGLGTDWDKLRGHGGNVAGNGTQPTSTVISCNVCHNDTVLTPYNANGSTCSVCHTAVASPTDNDKWAGNAAIEIADKSVHVDGNRDVQFFDQVVRSKAQLRDIVPDIDGANTNWTDIPELQQAWVRVDGYKSPDGLSYDESPDTLRNTGIFDNGAGTNGGTAANPTCLVSCHLINQTLSDDNLDKEPVGWADGGRMCIDCHTRLPK